MKHQVSKLVHNIILVSAKHNNTCRIESANGECRDIKFRREDALQLGWHAAGRHTKPEHPDVVVRAIVAV